jgi:hypothetical protein
MRALVLLHPYKAALDCILCLSRAARIPATLDVLTFKRSGRPMKAQKKTFTDIVQYINQH